MRAGHESAVTDRAYSTVAQSVGIER